MMRATQIERDKVNIGKSVVIKGELSGSEDLTIEGHVEGRIELRDNVLTIGPNGKIRAEVFAKAVIVLGEVVGNVTASEKVDIRDNGSVDGDIISPRVAIAEGAHFRGSVDMQRAGAEACRPGQPAQAGVPARRARRSGGPQAATRSAGWQPDTVGCRAKGRRSRCHHGWRALDRYRSVLDLRRPPPPKSTRAADDAAAARTRLSDQGARRSSSGSCSPARTPR